jgi:hypothetical protein
MKRIFLPATLLLLSCGDSKPPAPTAEESNQLNEAEDLLNEQAAAEMPPAE